MLLYDRCKMHWIGLDWIGLDWIGLDWTNAFQTVTGPHE